MKKNEFYKYYIPALIKALKQNCEEDCFSVKGPEHYIDESDDIKKEIDIYLDNTAGKDDLLDSVGYYFDALSHGFNEINGINIDLYKAMIENLILEYKKEL